MFVLLFRYVFGGAIAVNTKGGYVNFLLPGILAQTAAFACFGTAISLAQELKKGVIDRFRSMPMARSAVLGGQVADTARMTITILVVVGVGYAVGFRFSNGVGPAIGMVVLAIALGVACCCIAAYTGLAIGDEESVQAFGLVWLFPLTFLSSAFVPISTMPWAGCRRSPTTAHHVHRQRHAGHGPRWPDRDQPVEEHRLAGRHLHRLRAPLSVRAYKRAS